MFYSGPRPYPLPRVVRISTFQNMAVGSEGSGKGHHSLTTWACQLQDILYNIRFHDSHNNN